MKQTFTKKDLLTGDITEARNGDRGVVILEKNCILYQEGGLDELDIFTDDLFIDGPFREGDIFRVYRDPDGPVGLQKLYDALPVFRRTNNRATRERAAQIDDLHNPIRGRTAMGLLEPHSRKCRKAYVDLRDKRDIDLMISEAPSLTACGQIPIDRTYVRFPDTDNLFLLYNRFQEERHLKPDEEYKGIYRDSDPLVIIPEENLQIHSRCMVVRKNDSGSIEDLRDGDLESIQKYFHRMQLTDEVRTQW